MALRQLLRRAFGPAAQALLAESGEADPVVAIQRRAAQLIDEVGFDGPPFTPAVLASYQDIREVRTASMASAARLVPTAAGLVIEVNEQHCASKQNFSADHEVTHTLFPTYAGEAIDDPVTGQFSTDFEEEFLCDIGAAALLLDARWLRPMALDGGPSLHALCELADQFGASLQATALSIAQLDIWPCAFVLWEPGFRKSERVSADQIAMPGFDVFGGPQAKLRVSRPYASPSFKDFIPLNKSVDDNSLVTQCFLNEETTTGVEVFPFGRGIKLYSENMYAPYRVGADVRERVISLLLRSESPAGSQFRQPHYIEEVT